MDMAIRKARDAGRHIIFSPEANDFSLLEHTLLSTGRRVKASRVNSPHAYDEAVPWESGSRHVYAPGSRFPNRPMCCFMKDCTAASSPPQHDVARVMLIHWLAWRLMSTSSDSETDSRHQRARALREAVMDSVVRSTDDYINYITPQFSRTHINFQRVPTVDTSNPLPQRVFSLDESFCGDPFPQSEGIDFPRPRRCSVLVYFSH